MTQNITLIHVEYYILLLSILSELSKGKDVDENSFPASSLSEMWKQMSVC